MKQKYFHKFITYLFYRYKYLNAGASRLTKDGISTLAYNVKAVEKNKLYTKIIVSYNKDEIINSLKL